VSPAATPAARAALTPEKGRSSSSLTAFVVLLLLAALAYAAWHWLRLHPHGF
jgi:hypothetical protein